MKFYFSYPCWGIFPFCKVQVKSWQGMPLNWCNSTLLSSHHVNYYSNSSAVEIILLIIHVLISREYILKLIWGIFTKVHLKGICTRVGMESSNIPNQYYLLIPTTATKWGEITSVLIVIQLAWSNFSTHAKVSGSVTIATLTKQMSALRGD